VYLKRERVQINKIYITKVFKRSNILFFRTILTNRLIGQIIFEITVLLRLNHRITLPISHYITLLIFTLTSLETTLISCLRTVLLIKKLLARYLVVLYTALYYSETLE
jgi:hypothetical protein